VRRETGQECNSRRDEVSGTAAKRRIRRFQRARSLNSALGAKLAHLRSDLNRVQIAPMLSGGVFYSFRYAVGMVTGTEGALLNPIGT
jgi:hypothetical protein